MSWGIEEEDTIKLLRNPVYCRDVLMYQLVLASGKATNSLYPAGSLKPFANYKNLLLVFLPKANVTKSNIVNGVNLLNKIERELEKDWKKLRRTEIVKTDNSDYIVIDGSRFWKSSTVHASFWSLVLRTSLLSNKEITLPWLAQNYGETNPPLRDSNYAPILKWSDIIDYIPSILKQLKITQVSGAVSKEPNHGTTGLCANFRLQYPEMSFYGKECKRLLIDAMKAAGDPNEKKIPR